MNRVDFTAENAPLRILLDAERYLEERKVAEQQVGTHNVRTVASGPLSVDLVLSTPSPNPSIGVARQGVIFSFVYQDDAFCRIVHRLRVGGTWYRPSDRLTAIKNGQIPYEVRLYPRIVLDGMPRSQRGWQFVITGPIDQTVTLDIWVVSGGVQ